MPCSELDMATSKKPRKAYRPKPVRIDPVGHVLTGMMSLGKVGDELIMLRLKNHGALAALTQGRASAEDFKMLIAALNMTEALMMQKLGAEYSPELKAGQDALQEIGQRRRKLGRFVLKAEEMKALNLAMELHDAQLDICTVAQIERAIYTVRNAVRTGKATTI